MTMMYELIIIGGSYAGMAVALQLLRARRTVLVIDAGQRRNCMAAESHGFLGQDGSDPAEIARVAIERAAIARIDGHADVVLADGRCLAFAGLFTAPRYAPVSDIAQRIGWELMETPMGTQIHTTETKETSIQGASLTVASTSRPIFTNRSFFPRSSGVACSTSCRMRYR